MNMLRRIDLVLSDIEPCKKAQPIMERLGVEEDEIWRAYWLLADKEDHGDWSKAQHISFDGNKLGGKDGVTPASAFEQGYMLEEEVKAYRQDKLAWALPEWVNRLSRFLYNHGMEYVDYKVIRNLIGHDLDEQTLLDICSLVRELSCLRGRQQMATTVALLSLLDAKGVL